MKKFVMLIVFGVSTLSFAEVIKGVQYCKDGGCTKCGPPIMDPSILIYFSGPGWSIADCNMSVGPHGGGGKTPIDKVYAQEFTKKYNLKKPTPTFPSKPVNTANQ